MKFNLSNPLDKQRFKDRCNKLYKEGAIVELKKINTKRTRSQNNYLHLILTWYAIEYGETLQWVKQFLFKEVLNEDIFKTTYVNPKNNQERKDMRSTADLDTKEMTMAIDRFRNYANNTAGIYLPAPNETHYLMLIEIEMSKYNNQIFL